MGEGSGGLGKHLLNEQVTLQNLMTGSVPAVFTRLPGTLLLSGARPDSPGSFKAPRTPRSG